MLGRRDGRGVKVGVRESCLLGFLNQGVSQRAHIEWALSPLGTRSLIQYNSQAFFRYRNGSQFQFLWLHSGGSGWPALRPRCENISVLKCRDHGGWVK